MNLIIVSGGTGGHIYPGLAIAEAVQQIQPQANLLFIGSEDGLERDIISRAGFRLKLIKARALLRKLSYKALSAPFVSLIGFFQALYIIKAFSPQAVISTGGYVSLPVVLAAKCLGLPIYLHEQNVLPGLTNRLFKNWAAKIFLSFEASTRFLNGQVVGNPVRQKIVLASRELCRQKLGFTPEQRVVLVVGGSQGARTINKSVIASLPLIKDPQIQIIHIIGQRDAELAQQLLLDNQFRSYKKIDYAYQIENLLAAADLVVSRAGATAIAEFLILGLPMILIPFPFSAEGHQDLNAKVVVEAGAGILVSNQDFTPKIFHDLISQPALNLVKMKENCAKLAKPLAAKEIINAILN